MSCHLRFFHVGICFLKIKPRDTVHRLAAALGLLIRLSPFYDEQLKPLLEILQARGTLKAKLGQGNGWEGDGGVKKREVRGLIEEIADKLCA